jgi:DNA-binding response OmpR family regulator
LAKNQFTLLIVEDDLDVAEMLNAYFRVQGYDTQTVNWGEDCLSACQTTRPDLILLDINLPDIDGYEVAQRLRNNRRTQDIPIIFLTQKRGRADRLQGLELGADDYITKPFDVQELRLRVRNSLRRKAQGLLTNPITDLPERELVDERLRECLQEKAWAVITISLLNLDRFREAYGFIASDDVLRAIGLMIHNAMRVVGNPDDFFGHLGDTQFILLTSEKSLEHLQNRLHTRLEQSLDYFYPVKDRREGPDEADRLQINLGWLKADDGPFKDLDQLKTEILRRSTE